MPDARADSGANFPARPKSIKRVSLGTSRLSKQIQSGTHRSWSEREQHARKGLVTKQGRQPEGGLFYFCVSVDPIDKSVGRLL